jgi:FAD/FMN-containing dehydrogenase
MIGGMVGNNSSGTTSIRYGVNSDKIVEIKAILSDGSAAVFADLSPAEFMAKTKEIH